MRTQNNSWAGPPPSFRPTTPSHKQSKHSLPFSFPSPLARPPRRRRRSPRRAAASPRPPTPAPSHPGGRRPARLRAGCGDAPGRREPMIDPPPPPWPSPGWRSATASLLLVHPREHPNDGILAIPIPHFYYSLEDLVAMKLPTGLDRLISDFTIFVQKNN
uniref:Uncharacterized protein n=1 Tax=Oryza meridionalis TaxID=40149 RepID=A0A0E0CM73_9ORYZ